MDRRSFLRLAGLTGVSAALAPRIGFSAPRAGALPLPGPSIDRIPQIEHVVVLVMENHSFDNVLGTLDRPGVDGLTFSGGSATNFNLDAAGNKVFAYHLPDTCQDDIHVTQSWDGTHKQWNNGAMDGFVKTSGSQGMGYYTEADLPITHALAKAFPVCDRWFCSTMCQTFPNRLFMFAGTAQGSISTDVPERVQAAAPASGTIFDRLNAANVSWKNYFVDLADTMLWGPAYFAGLQGHILPLPDFFADAATGLLPAVSVITPEAFEASEENPQNTAYGEAYVWAVATAVMNSPAWSSTMLLITYDEHGGYYDHVPPVAAPQPDAIAPRASNLYGDSYTYTGFRVPTIVVSPWARANYVSHTVYDHTSILAFLEYKYGLPSLTARDAAANDMRDLFDFSSPSFATPPPIPLLPNAAQATVQCLQNGRTGISNPVG